MDVERLKHGGSVLDNEFFERQLEKIREIRLSERKFYQKITDIYATALDYDPTATTKQFFVAVQNKLHYAIHGQTAAEVIVDRADYVTKDVHKEIYSRCDPEYGNILYIKDGATTGIVTINNLKQPFSMLSSVALLKQPQQVEKHFLLFALRSPFFYQEMRAGMTGVAITRVTLEKLNYAIIPRPPLPEQHRIITKIDQLMARCDELEKLRAERERKRLAIHTAALVAE